MTDKTYVYDNAEVKLTGRKAQKKISGRGRGHTSETKVHELVEITPADIETGSWKNWVKMAELYEVLIDEEK